MCAFGLAQSARIQHEAVLSIEHAGGWVAYGWQRKYSLYERTPEWPAWVVDSLGIDCLDTVTLVTLCNAQGPGAELSQIANLSSLEDLNLWGSAISDAGMVRLAHLSRLKSLILNRTSISDAGLIHVGRLVHLEHLHIENNRITDAGLRHLKGLTRLRSLWLKGTDVSEEAIDELRKQLPRLEFIYY